MPVNETKEINEKMDSAIKLIHDIQEDNDRKFDKLSALDVEKIEKMSDEAAKNLEEVQKIKSNQKETSDSLKKMENLIINMAEAKANDNGEMEKKASEAFSDFLKNGVAMSKEVLTHNIKGLVKASYFGADSDKKLHYFNELLKKDMQVNVDPRGGYWVRPELATQIITQIFETSPIRGVAAGATTASDSLEYMIDDEEASGGWACETETTSTTDTPEVGQLIIYAHELRAKPRATQKMLDDAGFDIESWIAGKVSDKFSRLENSAFFNGDGVKKPKGLLTYPAATDPDVYQRGTIGQFTSTVSLSFAADDLKSMQDLVKEPYQPNSVWFMNRKTFGVVTKLKDTQTRYLLDTNSLKTGDTNILLGKSVIFAHDMPVSTSAGNLAIAYGDFSKGYTILDRMGIRIIRDIYTQDPYIVFKTSKRTGGDVTNYDSFKLLKIKA